MPLHIIRNNIVNVDCDAIVNTANPLPQIGAGTDSAVYAAAGKEQLLKARRKIGEIEPGRSAVTRGYGLKARYIIHTVGPVWEGGQSGEEKTLRSCYRTALRIAEARRFRTVAFPLISTGSYGYPKDEALDVAVGEIRSFLEHSNITVYLVVFGKEAYELSGKYSDEVEAFIDEHYVKKQYEIEYGSYTTGYLNDELWRRDERRRRGEAAKPYAADAPPKREELSPGEAASNVQLSESVVTGDEWLADESEAPEDEVLLSGHSAPETDSLMQGSVPNTGSFMQGAAPNTGSFMQDAAPKADFLMHSPAPHAYSARPTASSPLPFGKRKKKLEEADLILAETFSETLLRLIDERDMTDVEVYKRANIDRKLFSKIRSRRDYQPRKKTALALAIALRLDLDQTKDLLSRAGYAISPSSKFDLIVEFFIENEVYDIDTINIALFEHQEETLG